MRPNLLSHRSPGTGSVHREKSGKVVAYTPQTRSGQKTMIGRFSSRFRATQALEKWLAENVGKEET